MTLLQDTLQLKNSDFFREVSLCLQQGQSVCLRAKGNSMIPFIVGGRDSVIVQKAETALLKVGDIVLAQLSEEVYVLHRIIQITSERVVLQGDGHTHMVEYCLPNQVLGVVSVIIRKGKQVDCLARFEQMKSYLWRHSMWMRRCFLFIYTRLYL